MWPDNSCLIIFSYIDLKPFRVQKNSEVLNMVFNLAYCAPHGADPRESDGSQSAWGTSVQIFPKATCIPSWSEVLTVHTIWEVTVLSRATFQTPWKPQTLKMLYFLCLLACYTKNEFSEGGGTWHPHSPRKKTPTDAKDSLETLARLLMVHKP